MVTIVENVHRLYMYVYSVTKTGSPPPFQPHIAICPPMGRPVHSGIDYAPAAWPQAEAWDQLGPRYGEKWETEYSFVYTNPPNVHETTYFRFLNVTTRILLYLHIKLVYF